MEHQVIGNFLKFLFASFLFCTPLRAQNIASIEVPLGISFVYGFDYHPVWYFQIKPTVGFTLGDNIITGKWFMLQYGFSVEQRYYYNILKRQLKGKQTLHKSADFISFKPFFIYQHYQNDMLEDIGGSAFSVLFNWGLRRSISRRFYFEGSVGVGPGYDTYDKRFHLMSNLNACVGLKLF